MRREVLHDVRKKGELMGPHGMDGVVDQVKRRRAFQAANPGVLILSPRQNGTPFWTAQWADPDAPDGDAGDGAVIKVEHWELGVLLDHLERRLGRPS